MLYRILLGYALVKGSLLGLWRQPPPMVPTGPRVVRVKADYRVMFDQRRDWADHETHLEAYRALSASLPVNAPDSAWTAGRP